MSESKEIYFDTILKMEKVDITDVVEKDYIVYFKANGHQFQCASGRVVHKNSCMYDGPFNKYIAKRDNNPVEIKKEEKSSEEFNKNWNGWMEHEDKIIETAFGKMLPHILLNDMDKAKKVFEFYFDCILPGKGAEKMIKKLNGIIPKNNP